MPHPWEARAKPKASATDRIYRSLLKAGARVTDRVDVGEPGRWLGVADRFDCGCVRTFRALWGNDGDDTLTASAGETVEPCAAHRNLLTRLGHPSEDDVTTG